jgi:hypothetical protein
MTAPEFVIPAAMVEAAAAALMHPGNPDVYAEFPDGPVREGFRNSARRALTAALAGCEVREEWGVRWHEIESGGTETRWYSDSNNRDRVFEHLAEVWGHHTQRLHRLVITTPADEVPDGQP